MKCKLSYKDFERFLNKFVPEPNSGCWLWYGDIDRHGYGRFFLNNSVGYKMRGAHRVSYEYFISDIPEGMHVHHKCEVKSCVNPYHLMALKPEDHYRLQPSATKTHCDNGHPLSGENLYIRPSGWRDCRACIRDRVRRYKQRKAAA